MKTLGKPMLIIGAIIVLIALNIDVSVQTGYGRVNNFGLMEDRKNYLFLGALIFIAGLITTLANRPNKRETNINEKPFEMNERGLSIEATKSCPFCAETIKENAIYCRYCKKDLPKIDKPTAHTESSQSRLQTKSATLTADEYLAPEEATLKDVEQKVLLHGGEFSNMNDQIVIRWHGKLCNFSTEKDCIKWFNSLVKPSATAENQ